MLELEALISLVQRLADRGTARVRLLVLVDNRVVLGALSKGRSSSRQVDVQHRRLGGLFLAADLSLDLVWVLSWGNPVALGFTQSHIGANTCRGSLCLPLPRRSFRLPPNVSSSFFSSHFPSLFSRLSFGAQEPLFTNSHQAGRQSPGVDCSC